MEEHTHSSVGAFGYNNGEKCEVCKQLEEIEFNQTKFIFQLLEEIRELRNQIIEIKNGLENLTGTSWY